MHMHRVWLRAESFVPSLSSIRAQMTGVCVNRTLVQISISSLFPLSAFRLSLLAVLSPICCYMYLPDFFPLPVIFYLHVVFFYTESDTCASALPASLPSAISSECCPRHSHTQHRSHCRALQGL